MKSIQDIRRENLIACVAQSESPAAFLEKYAYKYEGRGELSSSYLSQLTGGTTNIGNTTARNLEKMLGKPKFWLDTDHSPFDDNIVPATVGGRSIPVISFVQAGSMMAISDPYPPGAGFDLLFTDLDLSTKAFALEINGLSMSPLFAPGDRIIIDPELAPMPGDFVVAKNGDEEATFKKYRPRGINERGQEVFELVPLNEDFETLYSERQPIIIIGVMVEHRKYRRRLRN